ncbi:MAG: hypothetical protein M1828_004745 [Chrysothrix sp. TS-e1954]|nr:MAG: hypothetical protein M1828_004745 [Chrysothrix sp. TS-e1954]
MAAGDIKKLRPAGSLTPPATSDSESDSDSDPDMDFQSSDRNRERFRRDMEAIFNVAIFVAGAPLVYYICNLICPPKVVAQDMAWLGGIVRGHLPWSVFWGLKLVLLLFTVVWPTFFASLMIFESYLRWEGIEQEIAWRERNRLGEGELGGVGHLDSSEDNGDFYESLRRIRWAIGESAFPTLKQAHEGRRVAWHEDPYTSAGSGSDSD